MSALSKRVIRSLRSLLLLIGCSVLITSCTVADVLAVIYDLFYWGLGAHCWTTESRVSIKFMGSKLENKRTYDFWQELERYGEGRPPGALKEGSSGWRVQGQSYFDLENYLHSQVDNGSANWFCKALWFAWDCGVGGNHAYACVTSTGPFGLIPANQRQLMPAFRRRVQAEAGKEYFLRFAASSEMLGHEALHASGTHGNYGSWGLRPHSHSGSDDDDWNWIYGGGSRYSAAIKADIVRAVLNGHRPSHGGYVPNWRSSEQWLKYSEAFTSDDYATLDASSFRDFPPPPYGEQGPWVEEMEQVGGILRDIRRQLGGYSANPRRSEYLGDQLAAISNQPACTTNRASEIFDVVAVQGDDVCRLKKTSYLPDTRQFRDANRIAIYALNPRMTVSEALSQADLDRLESAPRATRMWGNQAYFDDITTTGWVKLETLVRDQTPDANFCEAIAIAGGGWQPLYLVTQIGTDANGRFPAGATGAGHLFEVLEREQGILPSVFTPSYDYGLDSDRINQRLHQGGEPFLGGISREHNPTTHLRPFSGHGALTYAIRYGGTNFLRSWNSRTYPQAYSYHNYEEEHVRLLDIFVHPEQEHALLVPFVYGPVNNLRPQHTLTRTTSYHSHRVLCFKEL
jgi:hypothetical protein